MKRKIPYYQCLIITILMSLSLVISILFLKKPVYTGLFISIIISFFVSIINGYQILEIFNMMYKGLSKNAGIILIYTMIGMLIGIWKIGGNTPAILYYSLGIINKNIFLFSAFLISTLIGLLMGTSSGTVSTVGIVLIGLGGSMGLPLGAIAGAVISGAFFGDRSSPISGMLNAVSTMTDTKTNENFKSLWGTMSIGLVLSSLFYIIAGLHIKSADDGFGLAQQYKQLISSLYNISPWLVLPPIVLVGFAFFRIPIVKALVITIIYSGTLAVLYQNLTIVDVLKASIFGFNPQIQANYSAVLSGGGIASLKTMLIVLVFATSLNGIFEGTNMIGIIVSPIINKIKGSRDLQLFTIGLSVSSAILLCNQLMSVIIPSGVLKDKYKELGLEKKVFVSLLSDSGVMVSSLIPWNVAALTPAILMGISATDFIPYAFLSYIMPVIAIVKIFVTTRNKNNFILEKNL